MPELAAGPAAGPDLWVRCTAFEGFWRVDCRRSAWPRTTAPPTSRCALPLQTMPSIDIPVVSLRNTAAVGASARTSGPAISMAFRRQETGSSLLYPSLYRRYLGQLLGSTRWLWTPRFWVKSGRRRNLPNAQRGVRGPGRPHALLTHDAFGRRPLLSIWRCART